MKANKVKWVIAGGVLCVLLLLLSVWYAATFNGGRLVEPMDFSTYTFQVRDLPMLCSTALFTLYILGLAVWLVRWVLKSRRVVREANTTRSISPKLGFLGFLGASGPTGCSEMSLPLSFSHSSAFSASSMRESSPTPSWMSGSGRTPSGPS